MGGEKEKEEGGARGRGLRKGRGRNSGDGRSVDLLDLGREMEGFRGLGWGLFDGVRALGLVSEGGTDRREGRDGLDAV